MTSVTIRTLRSDDAALLLPFERANRDWFERHVAPRGAGFYTEQGVCAHIQEYLAAYASGTLHPSVMAQHDGTLIGRTNLKRIDGTRGTAEVGGRVARQHVGKGLATDALQYQIDLARTQWRLSLLFAHVADANLASAHVLERCGFVRGAAAHEAALADEIASVRPDYSIFTKAL